MGNYFRFGDGLVKRFKKVEVGRQGLPVAEAEPAGELFLFLFRCHASTITAYRNLSTPFPYQSAAWDA